MFGILTKDGFVLGFLIQKAGMIQPFLETILVLCGQKKVAMTIEFARMSIPSAWLSLPLFVSLPGDAEVEAQLAFFLRAKQAEMQEVVRQALNGFVEGCLNDIAASSPEALDALQKGVAAESHPASVLTAREQQVMEMLARGMTNREIAEQLEISIKTVDTHRGHLLKKLGLRNNSELTRFAVGHGYVTL